MYASVFTIGFMSFHPHVFHEFNRNLNGIGERMGTGRCFIQREFTSLFVVVDLAI